MGSGGRCYQLQRHLCWIALGLCLVRDAKQPDPVFQCSCKFLIRLFSSVLRRRDYLGSASDDVVGGERFNGVACVWSGIHGPMFFDSDVIEKQPVADF